MRSLGLLLAAPFLAVTAIMVTATLRPAWVLDLRPVNIAEAAAMGGAADVVRLLGLGEDPNRVYSVRPEIISSSIVRATALEAAMWSRRLEIVRLLDRRGAIVDADTRRMLACLARDLSLPDIEHYLSADPGLVCEKGQAFALVRARALAR